MAEKKPCMDWKYHNTKYSIHQKLEKGSQHLLSAFYITEYPELIIYWLMTVKYLEIENELPTVIMGSTLVITCYCGTYICYI